MVFYKASDSNISFLTETLYEYGLSSGQEISWEKSRIPFSHSVHPNKKITIRESLGVTQMVDWIRTSVPFPLGRKKAKLFYHIVDRVNSRINIWYNKLLSQAGWATLIQSVVTSIPVYSMTATRLPTSKIGKLDKTSWWDADKVFSSASWDHRFPWQTKVTYLFGLGFRAAFSLSKVLKLSFPMTT